MATIITRAGKGSPLTHNEVDANFVNLNDDKIEGIAVQDDAAPIVTSPTLNFTGSGVTVTDVAGVATVNVPGGGSTTVISNTDTGTQNDWAPTGYAAGHTIIEWAGTSFLLATGFPAGSPGDKITFVNNSTESVALFQHIASGSTSGQRIRASASNHEHGLIFPGEQAEFVFNGTLDQWIMAKPTSGPRTEWTYGGMWPGTGSAPTVIGMAALGFGTLGTASFGPIDGYDSFYKTRLDTGSGTGTGRVAGLRDQPRLLASTTANVGGFIVRNVWGYDDLSTNANSWFVGVGTLNGTPSAVNSSTFGNNVGWGKDDGDGTSSFFMHNDGSGTATRVPLPADYDQSTTSVFDGWVYIAPGETRYTAIIWRADDTSIAPVIYEVDTDTPAPPIQLNRAMYISNVAASDRYILNLKETEQWLN